jgi:GDP-L-fucose synthase
MLNSALQAKKITVTGGKGFLGRHLIRKLEERGCRQVEVADLPEYNLIHLNDVQRLYDENKPDIVIHLAAKVGGIGFNQENPASLFFENLMMGVQLLHEGYLRKIEKFVAIGTICAYPKFTPVPFREDDLWNGYPEETNAPYGLAKKMMLVQSQAYRKQYGFNSIFLLPVNLYGPGDNFDPRSSHVIPSLIKKVVDAMGGKEATRQRMQKLSQSGQTNKRDKLKGPDRPDDPVTVWGTGKATREFFYVEDAAEAIVLATDEYNKSDPVNIGAGFEISIRELINLIVELTGFKGKIVWDGTKPDGQPRRMLDTTRALREFGFKAKTDFREGLKKTIDWYVETRAS